MFAASGGSEDPPYAGRRAELQLRRPTGCDDWRYRNWKYAYASAAAGSRSVTRRHDPAHA